MRLTELGAVYPGHCERVLAAAEEGERTVRRLEQSPRGTLRLTEQVFKSEFCRA